MPFDPSKVKNLSTLSKAGGGYSNVRFAPLDELLVIPTPDANNSATTSNDFVFVSGKTWTIIFADTYKTKLDEKQNDKNYANSFTVDLSFFYPGDSNDVRQAVNDGYFSKPGIILIDNCKDGDTTIVGKGRCCPVFLTASFASGEKASDEKGWTFNAKVEQEGVCTKYKGVGAMSQTFSIAANDTSPDVSTGTGTYILPQNTAANEITALDNAVAGSLLTFVWNSTTNHSTFTNGETFQLAGSFTPVNGAKLVLQATTASTFAERYRELPA